MKYENPKSGETVYLPVFKTTIEKPGDTEFLLLTPAMVGKTEDEARQIGRDSLRAVKSTVAESVEYDDDVRQYYVREGGAIDQPSVQFPVSTTIRIISGPVYAVANGWGSPEGPEEQKRTLH